MRYAAVILVVAALAGPAAAATDPTTGGEPFPLPDNAVANVFRDVGLFGTFAADCGRPPTPENPHVSVSEPLAGLVSETHDVGATYAANRYNVISARRIDADGVEAKVIFNPGTPSEQRQTLVIRVGKGTRRTMFNRVDGGAVMVRHGLVLAVGKKTPVLRKCS